MGGSSLALMSSSNVLLKMKETSCAAVGIYDHLQLGKKWNLPGKHVNNAVIVPKCDNCDIPIISLLSAPSLAMRKSARKLGKYRQRHGTLREAEVVKAVEVEVAAEVVQVVGLVLKGSMLLGTVQQKATTLE